MYNTDINIFKTMSYEKYEMGKNKIWRLSPKLVDITIDSIYISDQINWHINPGENYHVWILFNLWAINGTSYPHWWTFLSNAWEIPLCTAWSAGLPVSHGGEVSWARQIRYNPWVPWRSGTQDQYSPLHFQHPRLLDMWTRQQVQRLPTQESLTLSSNRCFLMRAGMVQAWAAQARINEGMATAFDGVRLTIQIVVYVKWGFQEFVAASETREAVCKKQEG